MQLDLQQQLLYRHNGYENAETCRIVSKLSASNTSKDISDFCCGCLLCAGNFSFLAKATALARGI